MMDETGDNGQMLRGAREMERKTMTTMKDERTRRKKRMDDKAHLQNGDW